MGPKVKRPPKNSFSFFLDDYVEQQRLKGRNISKKIAQEECAPAWKNLSEEEKEIYTEMAKSHKSNDKNNLNNKFTSDGVSLAQKQNEERKAEEARQKMEAEINDTVLSLAGTTLKTHLFYIVHCNYYCRTEENTFVPAELAIAEFSLRDGVHSVYHTLINPIQIPSGYAYEAKENSEKIHCLPMPPYEGGETDYFKIFDDIIAFLEPGKRQSTCGKQLPPVYTIQNNYKASSNILQLFTDAVHDQGHKIFRVYPLEKLFFKLKNRCCDYACMLGDSFPVLTNAVTEIDKDVFCYVLGISCKFHTGFDEKYQNCSQSVVQRFAYMICDHCCQYVGVELIPDKHCPRQSDTNRLSSRGSSVASAISSTRTSRTPSEAGDDVEDMRSSASSVLSVPSQRSQLKNAAEHIELPKDSIYTKQAEAAKPLKAPKTVPKTFIVKSTSDAASSVASFADDDDDDGSEWSIVCAGRGKRINRPIPSVGRASPDPPSSTPSVGRASSISSISSRGRGISKMFDLDD